MSKLFKINYELSDNSTLTAGIVSDSKEKATSYLKTKVPSVARVHSISVAGDIHALDDEIVNRFVNNSSKVKGYQQKIKHLNEQLKEQDVEIQNMREQLDSHQQQPSISSKDIKEALKSNQPQPQQQPEPEVQVKVETKKIYVCPYCDFETEKKKGLKTHISRIHKES